MKNGCLIIIAIVFTSCGTGSVNNQEKYVDEKSAAVIKIDSLQKILHQNSEAPIDKHLGEMMVNMYVNFSKKFPDEKKTPDYLFRAAEISGACNDYKNAIEFLNTICEKYSSYDKTPDALFLQGFFYQDKIQDLNKAKLCYEKLIKQYPNHHFAKDAEALMRNFGKTDEQIIKEFKEKEKRGNI